MNRNTSRPRYAARLSLCVGLMVSAAALAAPPDPPNAFNVGQFNNLNIAGTQNIFSAGLTQPWGPNCQVTAKDTGKLAAGTLPTEIAVPPNAVWVSFENVVESSPIGSVDFRTDSFYYSGDGWSASGADSTTIFGPYRTYAPDSSGNWTLQMVDMAVDISGIKAPGTMFLTGAFRDSSAPTSTTNPNIRNYYPAGWTAGTIYQNLQAATFAGDIQKIFAETNKATYQDLLLNQSYWIGDGRDKFEVMAGATYRSGSNLYSLGAAAKGNVQYFKIPKGATRLYLGFSDANGFYGVPGCYWDNPGALTVSGTFWGPKPPTVSVSCDRTSLVDADSNVATCTITSDQAAPVGGLPVALTPPAASGRYTSTCVSPLKIAEGATTAQCTITATANTVVGDGPATATLALASSATSAYIVGDPASAQVVVNDDDVAPSAVLSCTPTSLADSDGNVATCTVTLSAPAPAGGLPLALTLPASNPRYTTTCASPLTVAAGATTVVCTITATANTVVGDGDVVAALALAAGSGYALGTPASVDITVRDDDRAIAPAAVPTLSQWALMLLGLGVMGGAWRQRRR